MSIYSPKFRWKKVLCKNDLYVAINVEGKRVRENINKKRKNVGIFFE